MIDAMNDDLPARVQQDDCTPANGNALQACVCSLLGKTLSETPNFVKAPEGYEKAIADFLREHDGRRPVKVALPSDALDAHDGRLCILRGTSPRGDFGHVARRRRPTHHRAHHHTSQVVARYRVGAFENVWDPHPDGAFLAPPRGWAMFFV